MQQDRGFDKNVLLAMLLMGALMMGYFYMSMPSKEELKERERQEQLALETAQQNAVADVAVVDSAQVENGSAPIEVVAKDYEVESEKFVLKFSGQGGYISELRLKEYTAFDEHSEDKRTPLYLINSGNNNFNLKIKDKEGRVINTAHLPFTPSVKESGDKTIVTMKTGIGNAQLEYVYTIAADFTINFDIKSNGLQNLTNESALGLDWNLKASSIEKGKQQEAYWSQTYYRFKDTNDVEYKLFGSDRWNEKKPIDWIAFKQQFFASILSFDEGFEAPEGGSEPIDEDLDPKHSRDYFFTANMPIAGNELDLKMRWDFVPLDYKLLAYNQYEGTDFGRIIPFGWGFLGWINRNFFLFIFQWLAKTGVSYGWVILLMTIVVKLVLSPIMYKQFRQSAMMRILRPELNEINEKYKGKDNALKRQQKTMDLYRKAGANPLSGCLPALLQIPIFYALFRFFPNVIDLRGKSFLWADDLTAFDSPILIPEWIPFMNGHISVFALLYIIAMVIYFRVSGSMDSFNQPPQEGMPDMRMMKYMMYVMPVFFFVFLNNYASGLSLYYLASNFINIGIVLVIKNVLLDDQKIKAKIQENKAKPKKKSKWSARMQEIMEQAQEQQKLREQQKLKEEKKKKK